MEKVKQVWALAKANPKISACCSGSGYCYIFFSKLETI